MYAIILILSRYLGHLYMAEALVALDKIADGIQHLNPELVTDINTLPPEPKSDQGKRLIPFVCREGQKININTFLTNISNTFISEKQV